MSKIAGILVVFLLVITNLNAQDRNEVINRTMKERR